MFEFFNNLLNYLVEKILFFLNKSYSKYRKLLNLLIKLQIDKDFYKKKNKFKKKNIKNLKLKNLEI
jgi:hypothetical protein